MTSRANSVGARRFVEMLLGGDQAVHWSRPVLRVWGFLLVLFVLLFVWFPIRMMPEGPRVLLWLVIYLGYLLTLEILARKAKPLYESKPFRLLRIQFNLGMNAVLMLVAPAAVYGYLWFFFSMPIFAVLLYFGGHISLLGIYFEICVAMLILSLARGTLTPVGFASMLAQDVILGLLAAVFYFFIRFFPQLREEDALLQAATTLLNVIDQKELCQLLADAAQVGVNVSDATVVHLLGGEDNQTLVPLASSHLDITTMGRTPMEVGVGIAGHAIQNHETINVCDVNEDARYLQLPPSFTSFRSLLVAPMYVGDRDVGTISMHSAKRGAFGESEERFLTTLAAQGATAIANAELHDIHTRRRQQLSDILEASRAFGLDQPLGALLDTVAAEVCRCSGFRMAVVNLLDKASDEVIVRAMFGVPLEGRHKLQGMHVPLEVWKPLLRDEFQISQSYFIRHNRCPEIPDLDQYTFALDLDRSTVGQWHHEDMLIVPIQTREEELLGYISVDDPGDWQLPTPDTVQALEILASVAATAIRNTCLYQELEQRIAQLALINDVGGKIATVLDVDSVLERAVHLVQESFGYHHVALFILDREQDTVVMRARAGDFIDLFPPYHRIVLGQGMVGWVGDSGETLLANDVQAEPRYVNFFPDVIPTQSELSVPVRVGEEVVGVLDVQSPRRNVFDENDVMVMEILADQVAVAIDNARLYEKLQRELTERRRAEHELRQRNRELQLINRAAHAFSSTLALDQVLATILEEGRHLLDVHASAVWLVDPKTDGLVCGYAVGPGSEIMRHWSLGPGEGLAGWVAHTGESLIVPDTRDDGRYFVGLEQRIGLELRSILSIPLWLSQRVIGVLQMVDTEVDRFGPSDLTLLEPLAASAAIAIENARLYEEADRLRAFNESIIQNMEEGILLEDAKGHITFVNPKAAELLGYSPMELIGQHWSVTAVPEEVAKVEAEAAVRSEGVASRYETVLRTRDGQRVPVIVSATSLFEEGSFKGVLAAFTDITDRKRQETRLQDYLSTVTSSLAQHTSLDGLYGFIVEAGAQFLSASSCALFILVDGTDGVLKLVAAVGSTVCRDRSSAFGATISTGLEGGLVAHVAEICRPIRLSGEELFQHPSWNADLWQRLEWDLDPRTCHSLLGAPICLHDGQLVGVLVAWDAEGREGFSQFDEVLLSTLATNTAADIERVRGLEKARQDAIQVERKRLEADIHEAMNVLITGVRWEAEIISEELSYDDLTVVRIALNRLQAALARAYTDLRYVLQDLRDPTLEQEGLLIALKKRADLVGHGHIVVRGDLQERFPPEVEGVLYRVGQEGMSNAVKHSTVLRDPDVKIEVCLEKIDGQVRLWVKDNGVGFDVRSTMALTHKWGLRRLRDILKEIGGELDIDSAPGKGTMICATIGLETAPSSHLPR